MIDITGLREDKRPQSSTIVHALLDRLEAAEAEALEQARLNGMGSEREAALLSKLEAAEKERDALRAKIAEMERQEPVAKVESWTNGSYTRHYKLKWLRDVGEGAALYALPGAQSAPSVPDATWLPVPDKHPTFDPVDLRLADGSVLCGCVPQSDGDYWWEGPSGEVFIDPRYAPVTHWRLSAAPEAKP